jgi:hypothetical protein
VQGRPLFFVKCADFHALVNATYKVTTTVPKPSV